MDKEFLVDYEQNEYSEYEKFRKKVLEGKFDPTKERYPPEDRFHNLNEPIAEACSFGSIWPQIPLFGSLIIPIFPRDNAHFREMHGFEANDRDIERLVDFAKDTGKIQFALRSSPTAYQGLDFLEPIFKELRPPSSFVYPIEDVIEKKQLKRYTTEFQTLAQYGLIEELKGIYSPYRENYVKKRLDAYFRGYITLKYLGYDDIVEKIEEAMVYDLTEALGFYAAFGNLIVAPKINPLRATRVFDREHTLLYFQKGRGITEFEQEMPKIRFDFDIGKFLMSKLTYMPESLDACKAVIDRYKQEDLYKVAEALDKGIKDEHEDTIFSQTIEFETILDDLWKDCRVEMRKVGINYGIPASLCIVGTLGTLISGSATGILAGLGFSAADRIIGLTKDRISEVVAKLITPNHCVAIYDFKKKYEIKD